jgi:hypothetical protein
MKKVNFKALFQKQVTSCIQAFKTISIKQTSSQYRVVCNQFLDCLKQFQNQVEINYFVEKLVDAGESLLEIRTFHHFADAVCFQKAAHLLQSIDGNGSHNSKIARLRNRIFFGQCLLEYLKIAEIDCGFQTDESASRVRGIVEKMKRKTDSDLDREYVSLLIIYHSLEMTRLASVQNKNFEV